MNLVSGTTDGNGAYSTPEYTIWLSVSCECRSTTHISESLLVARIGSYKGLQLYPVPFKFILMATNKYDIVLSSAYQLS